MEATYILILLYVFCVSPRVVSSWFFSDNQVDVAANSDLDNTADSQTSLNIRSSPFEINTADDKFLLEASIAKDLSILDACHHRVVAELEGRCSDLSEEELAKLSVQLFNCQAAVEKRPTYPCTSDMAIADCTHSMDPTTWNAYQIVSNRARSICYGVRQQHFRARAELTVNRLMASSEQQLNTLATISQTQEQLKAVADNTIDKLEIGRRQIAADQQQLKQAHLAMNSQVLRNRWHIRQQRDTIIAANGQLISKTEQIQQKLDSTSEQISEQATVQSARHTELLSNLAHLGAQAEDVSSKLEASTTWVENSHRSMVEHQLDAIENLKQINYTVNFLLSLVNSFRGAVEAKLEWIRFVTDATDSHVAVISVIAAHTVYALVALSLFSLLHVMRRTSYLLITIILSNVSAELLFNCGLGFAGLSAVLLVVGLAASFIVWCWAIRFHSSPPSDPITESALDVCDNRRLSSDDIKYVIAALEQISADFARRISGTEEKERLEDEMVACSTPIRRLPEPGFEHSSGFPLNCSPPPIRRHLLPLPATPPNPPPSPLVRRSSIVTDSGIQQLGVDDVSLSGSPVSSASFSTTRQKKRRTSSLSRSFSRPLCTAMTKSGHACKLPSQEGSSFCHHHQLE